MQRCVSFWMPPVYFQKGQKDVTAFVVVILDQTKKKEIIGMNYKLD